MTEKRILENDCLRIEVSDFGAELSVIYDKENQRSVLWDADPDFWGRHAPVLFPIVGSLQDGKYRYKGETYQMPQHGFARDSVFELLELTQDRMIHKLCHSEETKKIYPFEFSLYITHILEGKSVTVGWKVVNEQNDEMFFSIGAHPAFFVPAEQGTYQKDYYLLFGDLREVEYVRITAEGTTKSKSEMLRVAEGAHLIEPELFDEGVLIFKNAQCREIGIAFPDESEFVKIECDGFPFTGVWTKPGAPFVCLEPWFGIADKEGFDGEFSEKEGIEKLAGKETFQAAYRIFVK